MELGKHATILLIAILIASSLTVVKAGEGPASIPKPSVPEFTVQFVSDSSVRVTIKNQPFNASYDILCYNIRVSPHNCNSWTELYQSYGGTDNYPGYLIQSGSDYTELTISVGTQTDIQVEAIIGHMNRVYNPNSTNPITMWPWKFVGKSSGWSNTQTITIDESTPTATPTTPSPTASALPSQNPEVTPTQPITQTGLLFGLDWEKTVLAVLALAVAILAVAVVVLWRKVTIKSK